MARLIGGIQNCLSSVKLMPSLQLVSFACGVVKGIKVFVLRVVNGRMKGPLRYMFVVIPRATFGCTGEMFSRFER